MSTGKLEIGNSYFIRTLTYHYTGKVAGLDDKSVFLLDAAWVADSGRFSDALKTGTLSEVEPYPGEGECSLMLNNIVDFSPWNHPLPKEQI